MLRAKNNATIKNIVFQDDIAFNKIKNDQFNKNIDRVSVRANTNERLVAKKGASSMLNKYSANTKYIGNIRK
jgi:hypothetical protein